MIDRRRFLKAASLTGLGMAGGAFAMQHQTRVRQARQPEETETDEPKVIPLALQLYSVREACAEDLAGTVAQVAEMGYDGVEFAGYHGHSAEQVKQILDFNGLKCAGTHIGIDQLLGDALEPTIEFHKTIGCEYLIVPGLGGDYVGSKDNWLRAADAFNQIAENLRPHDM
ncbi:MAG: TIM barrel protein, partial [Armatimonadia bacterium]|nr:TIM barrel protein [Armatimonadia bacterium]